MCILWKITIKLIGKTDLTALNMTFCTHTLQRAIVLMYVDNVLYFLNENAVLVATECTKLFLEYRNEECFFMYFV